MDGWRPEWPAPAGVGALCTTRQGGVSLPPYDSLNLGLHVQDDAAQVHANRLRLQTACSVRPVFLTQVHGINVRYIDVHTPDGIEADACWTDQAQVACTIMVADCLPVLFTDVQGRAVAAAHAGWRGLASGVLESTVQQLCAATACPPQDLLAWLGPCIGPQSFEVGEDVYQCFMQEAQAHDAVQTLPEGAFRTARVPGKWWADLAALARWRLQRAGVQALFGNDSTARWCTVSNSARFFSYRRDGRTGRFAACIWRHG